jgi:hypothetical protein
MVRNAIALLAGIAFLGATAGSEISLSPANAAMPVPKVISSQVDPNVQLVDPNVQLVAKWVYKRDRHGKRYKVKRKGYGYRYGNWWYSEPWWRYNDNWAYAPRYGKRYRSRYPGYAYYYDGYWYPRPWWRPGITLCIGC